jgi:hypothetical protein
MIGELELLFDEDDLDYDCPTGDQLYSIYGIFLDHFHRSPLIHRERKIIFNTSKSRHPLFRGKFEGFVHVVTRKSQYTERREYDRDRANRIHWIKTILDNWESPRVTYFERRNDKNELQYFYWVQSLKFIVILREVHPDLLLVTAYCLDDFNTRQYKKYYEEFKGRK